MSRRIDVCGVQMDTGQPDADGVTWKVMKLNDWTSPSHEQDLGRATGRPGATLLTDAHGAHSFSIEGRAIGATLEVVDGAADRLNRMPGVGASGDIVVYESTPKAVRVRQGVAPKADTPEVRNDGWYVDFLLTFVSLDPYKRGLTPRSAHLNAGGTVSVTNAGNVPAVLSLTATSAGTVIVRQNSSGQVLRTRAAVASGTHFDGPGRSVTTAAGLTIFPMGAPSEWLSIPAESTVTLASLGTAGVDVSWFDPYA